MFGLKKVEDNDDVVTNLDWERKFLPDTRRWYRRSWNKQKIMKAALYVLTICAIVWYIKNVGFDLGFEQGYESGFWNGQNHFW